MIVKNEASIIKECLDDARPIVDYILIEDTGSTDGTQEIVRDYLRSTGTPGVLFQAPWQDFGHNRTLALARLRERADIDYALILDADDMIVREDGFDPVAFRDRLKADLYHVWIVDSPLRYLRPQICNNRREFRYKGVLHEFMSGPPEGFSSGRIEGFHITRNARKGARARDPETIKNDVAVLEQVLAAELDSGMRARYLFHLAHGYRANGRIGEAAQAYAQRAELGGWDEEVWYSRLSEARCRLILGDEDGFQRTALHTYNLRPHRAEPLYDLAKFHRERKLYETSALFCEAALALPKPDRDILFIDDFIYQVGLPGEYVTASHHSRDRARRERGAAICNRVALQRGIPAAPRNLARSNLMFFVEAAATLMPSFIARPVGFVPPAGWRPSNPSIARSGQELFLLQRTVNYRIVDGRYETVDGTPVTTRNFLLRLGDDLAIRSAVEILPPENLPPPAWPWEIGFTDCRLFFWQHEWWCSSTARQLNRDGWCEQVLARIGQGPEGVLRFEDWRVLRPDGPQQHEKNWMPLVDGDALRFIYLCDPTRILDERAQQVSETLPQVAAENFRGGSQAIQFDDGWLTLIHEVTFIEGRRRYHHRFVAFDTHFVIRRISRRFCFDKQAIEFAAGLAWHPDGRRLVVSYGVGDREAWIGTVDATDVRHLLVDVAEQYADAMRNASARAREPAAPPTITRPEGVSTEPKRTIATSGRPVVPVFIHASWRTCSTWFWSRFRALPETLCFYEPFNTDLATLTEQKAKTFGARWHGSRHPDIAPYYLEYLPFVQPRGGVRLYDPRFAFDWFIPQGGINGELRPGEKWYLRQLLSQGRRARKTPVLGFTRSLGRSHAIKQAFGGFHILQYRNLFRQWCSYVRLGQLGGTYFLASVPTLFNRADDAYLASITEFYLKRGTAAPPAPGAPEVLPILQKLPMGDKFAMFMALHVYLYLHTSQIADLVVDATELARHEPYRVEIEHQLSGRTGLDVRLLDGTDEPAPHDCFDIDWEQIRVHGRNAAEALGSDERVKHLVVLSDQLIDAAAKEESLCAKLTS
jgi:glycosyltransferase involved in cell wall biosynthesis